MSSSDAPGGALDDGVSQASLMHKSASMTRMAAVKGRSKRSAPRNAPTVLLQGRVSPEAHAAARAAADDAGMSIAAYLEALVLADREACLVRPKHGTPKYRQEAITA